MYLSLHSSLTKYW